ncbi:hypothetical protein DSCO28_71200 [Desulfosarcina ovata subsp. sediminis]|uniref:PEP-CTERM protein-sorting domain-containing protein n=2 Tax=Desulfosarcina ovata TaxID=83564 RepID=A0A5K8A2K0_9BACT|nr:hypothetical protein DSCO28_71200 [Desulfosarcina ovata subsp. sediminis]
MWTASGGAQDLGDLGGGDTWAYAYDVSADGSTVVGYSSFDGQDSDAFIWNASDGMTALGLAEGKEGMETEAFGISADGSVVVGKVETESGGWEAAIWDASGDMTVLGGLEGGGDAVAYTVSGDGSVIIGYAENADGDNTAILWTEELGIVDFVDYLLAFGIDISEWDDLYALGISDDGLNIVGYGEDPNGDHQGWMVTLDASSVPVPGAVWLLGSGLFGLMGIRRKMKN